MAAREGRRTGEEEAGTRPRWSPLAYALCGAAAIFFITCTLPALQGEKGVRDRHRRLRERRLHLERVCADLRREIRSLRQDPQARKVRLDRLSRVLGPPPRPAGR